MANNARGPACTCCGAAQIIERDIQGNTGKTLPLPSAHTIIADYAIGVFEACEAEECQGTVCDLCQRKYRCHAHPLAIKCMDCVDTCHRCSRFFCLRPCRISKCGCGNAICRQCSTNPANNTIGCGSCHDEYICPDCEPLAPKCARSGCHQLLCSGCTTTTHCLCRSCQLFFCDTHSHYCNGVLHDRYIGDDTACNICNDCGNTCNCDVTVCRDCAIKCNEDYCGRKGLVSCDTHACEHIREILHEQEAALAAAAAAAQP